MKRTLSRIFTTDHRALGIYYLYLALAAVTVGTILSLMMRVHRVWPDVVIPFVGVVKPEDYLAMVTMHGTLMVFLCSPPRRSRALRIWCCRHR